MINMFSQKPKLKKIIGLRNIITNGNEWKYLLLYDIDRFHLDIIRQITEILDLAEISYIIYKTKHGLHIIGLTPMFLQKYAYYFQTLQNNIPEYYSGQTLRVSLKEGEKQELIYYNFNYPVLPNLLRIYDKRFNYESGNVLPEFIKERWSLVFEKYWSSKT